MSTQRSYAQATSSAAPSPTSSTIIQAPKQAAITVVDASHALVKEWLQDTIIRVDSKGTAFLGPVPPRANRSRSASEPLVTVIRNGRIYTSRPTPPGELNARERRKLRRAAERGEISWPKELGERKDDGSEAAGGTHLRTGRPNGSSADSTAVNLSEGHGYDYTFPPIRIPAVPQIPKPETDSLVYATNPFTSRDTLKASASSSSSSSDDLDPITPPDSPPRPATSRRPSLNAQAPEFSPSRICPSSSRAQPLTRDRPRSLHLQTDADATPAEAEVTPEMLAASGLMPQGRRHSIALAAWHVAQRRLSQQYDSPDYADATPNWHAVASPQSAPAFGDGSPLQSPQLYAAPSHGFPSSLSTPQSAHFSAHPSPAKSYFGQESQHPPQVSRRTMSGDGAPARHRSTHSCSSLPTPPPLSAPSRQPYGPGASPSHSRNGSLWSVHAELGEDTEADRLDDLSDLTLATFNRLKDLQASMQRLKLQAAATSALDPSALPSDEPDSELYQSQAVNARRAAFARWA